MMWQKVAFLLGFVPNVALAAKVPHVPVLPRQTPGISISDDPGSAGGYVEIPQHTSDGGPGVTILEATLTVPNLTFASGQSSAGAPYQLGVGCGIYAVTDANSKADCNLRGPHMGINANLGSDGLTTPSAWTSWPYQPRQDLNSSQSALLNLTAGDDVSIQISVTNTTFASYTFLNLKDTTNSVTIEQTSVTSYPICSGDGTTIYAGCALGVADPSKMPGFVELDFEAVMVYDRSNTTHDFGLDQQVQFYRLVSNGKVLAMPQIEEPYDFTVQWSENPDYGVGIGGGPSTTSALSW
ncbi:hypothetical protein PG985_012572 [Apiospora marii]|uniref:Peptidase A1 domain-containing protein n=1 Tax=Apiospora marii TaxID=335849 RepID=A0ABR1RE28_9PEZI